MRFGQRRAVSAADRRRATSSPVPHGAYRATERRARPPRFPSQRGFPIGPGQRSIGQPGKHKAMTRPTPRGPRRALAPRCSRVRLLDAPPPQPGSPMKAERSLLPRLARCTAPWLPLAVVLAVAGCASSSTPSTSPTPDMSTSSPTPDPRIGLAPGLTDAAQAAWNMRLVSNTMSPEGFAGVTNSDLAFTGNFVLQGNYNGFQVWDVSDPRKPFIKKAYLCPASQSDVSVYRNLLFVSGEGRGGRLDCGAQGVEDSVSHDRLRGIRIFDITDITNPKYVANVQTCRGSHTHTVVSDPNDRSNVYIYVSGSSSVRSPSELPGCSDLSPDEDPNSARFRIEVIRVPLANPQAARIVTSPRIFTGLTAPPRRGEAAGSGPTNVSGAPQRPRTGPNQCHDITVYPAAGLAGGACVGYGLLIDIRD